MTGKIKGITIEIGGDTTGLDKAISKVNGTVKKTQSELNEVNKLLKFNPGNADLIAQKQQLLAKQIQNTADKLKTLKDAQSQVDDQFKNGKINDEQYRAFNREVINAEQSLNSLKSQLASVGTAQQELQSKTQQLDTLFKATGTSIDQYADSLGTGLVNAIKNGKASASQLDVALAKIGKEALGSSADIDKMKQALKSVDDGASIKGVKKDLSDVAKEAKNAGDEVNGFGDNLSTVVGGLAAGGGIAGVVSKALDTSSLNTKIDISMDVPEESIQSVKNAVSTVTSYGVDGEAALEGVRRQWALNKDASDESNSAVVSGAATIAAAYAGVDFNELIQETNEIAKTLGITNEEALGLTNSLLKAGFPPEQIDIIAEYGDQMIQAGFSAKEVQQILAAGVDTKSWNIDNLLDGVKEGRIQMADFGSGLNKEMEGILSQTDISADKFVGWGQAIAKGGEGGQKAMLEATKALASVEDATVRNQLGTKMFGTMWEDQGTKIVDTIINAEKKQVDLKKGVDDLKDSTSKLDASPAVAMKQAFSDMQTKLAPLLISIAKLITKIAEWVQNNPTLAATIAAVASAIGIIVGAAMVLAPIFTAISSLAGVLGVSLAAIAGPIGIAIAAIALIVAAGIAIYKNWDGISEFFVNLWEGIKTAFSTAITGIIDFVKNNWQTILTVITGPIGLLVSLIVKNWDTIKSATESVWNGIKSFLGGLWNGIKSVVVTVWDGIKTAIVTVWNGLKTGATTIFNAIKTVIIAVWNGIKSVTLGVWNGIKSTVTNVWNGIKTTTSTVLTTIKTTISNIFNGFKNVVSTAMTNVKTAIQNGWNTAKSFLQNISLAEIGKNIIQGLVNGINTAKDKISSAIKTLADGIPKTIKKILGIHSPSKVMKDDVGYWITEGLAKGIEANTNAEKAAKKKAEAIIKASKEKLKERFTDDKTYYTNKSKLDSTSLQEELDILNKLSAGYEKSSDERIYFENLAKQKKEEVTAAKQKIDENYLSKVQELNKKYIDEEKRLTDEYTKAVDDRAKSLYSFAGLFDEVTAASEVSGQQLLANLQGQVTTFEQWQKSLADLAARGVDQGLISELQQMGPKSAAEVAALNTLTEEQLTQYQGLWKTKSNLARTEAVAELEGMRIDTANQIAALQEETAKQLVTYQSEWKSSMTKVTGNVKDMSSQMPAIGANAVQGLINGMNSKKEALAQVAAELAALVASTTQSALDIHSPSRVMKKLGNHTTEGFIEGIQQAASKLSNAVNNMYGSLANSAQKSIANATYSSSTSSTVDSSKTFAPVIHNYGVTDSNKATERTLRRLAFQFN